MNVNSNGSADVLDLASYLRSGDTVTWGQACAEPRTLTAQLMAQRHRIGDFRCFLGIPATDTVRPEHADVVSFVSYCGSGGNRALHRAGVLDVLPCHYSRFPDVLSVGPLAVDVVMLLLPPPDARGRYSLGLANEYLSAAIARARVVIAEVSDRVPFTGGHTLSAEAVDVVVRTDVEPAGLIHPAPSPVMHRIADQVAGLIEDGSTLQLGIGGLPEAILTRLTGHRDLGIHSGLINDGVADLMDAGIITNARKSIDPGRAVAGVVMGSRRLFDFADRNAAIELRDTGYTHDPGVLAGQDRFVAINSALEVDLMGQVNSEVARGEYVGAVGGAPDFLRGAARSRGGIPIVALPSTAGAASRIVATLNGPVSLARGDAAVIVTEFGVADLRGLPLSRRAERMLDIAHPDHRPALEAAIERGVKQ